MADHSLLACVIVPPGGSGDGARAALAAAGTGEIELIGMDAAGAWAGARNEALLRAARHELLALVDAGVSVGGGWLNAAHELLSSEDVGMVGGPLRAGSPPPAGLDATRHAQVLGLTEGPVPAGGNAVLRTAALRAIGGFPPVAGHAAAVDDLADWALVAEQLGAAGWRAAFDERMAATRDLGGIGYGSLLRRRLQTGARAAVLDPDATPPAPARASMRSAAGAVAAIVRGNRSGAADRLAWAAAQAGSAAGPWPAHAGLQPDRSRTPWQPSVAPAQPGPLRRRMRRCARGRGDSLVLLYHRVCDLPDDPLAVAVSPAHFAEQMAVLAGGGRVARLADVVSGVAPRGSVAITFDDGYADNLRNALTVLDRAGLPATLYAATGQIERGDGFWWDTVGRLVASGIEAGGGGPLSLGLAEGVRTWRPGPGTGRMQMLGQIHSALRPRSAPVIAEALAAIAEWAGSDLEPPDRDRPMTVDELRGLANAGPFDVQSHGRDHLSLALVGPRDRRADLAAAAADLEDWLGRRPTQLAYPFGVPGVDVDRESARDAEAAGYRLAVVNAPGPLRRADPHMLPRRAVPDIGGERFEAWLATGS